MLFMLTEAQKLNKPSLSATVHFFSIYTCGFASPLHVPSSKSITVHHWRHKNSGRLSTQSVTLVSGSLTLERAVNAQGEITRQNGSMRI